MGKGHRSPHPARVSRAIFHMSGEKAQSSGCWHVSDRFERSNQIVAGCGPSAKLCLLGALTDFLVGGAHRCCARGNIPSPHTPRENGRCRADRVQASISQNPRSNQPDALRGGSLGPSPDGHDEERCPADGRAIERSKLGRNRRWRCVLRNGEVVHRTAVGGLDPPMGCAKLNCHFLKTLPGSGSRMGPATQGKFVRPNADTPNVASCQPFEISDASHLRTALSCRPRL